MEIRAAEQRAVEEHGPEEGADDEMQADGFRDAGKDEHEEQGHGKDGLPALQPAEQTVHPQA